MHSTKYKQLDCLSLTECASEKSQESFQSASQPCANGSIIRPVSTHKKENTMSFRIQYAGHIRKSETKTFGDKTFVEVQLCAKNYAKSGEEPTFTWLRVSVVNPKDFQIPQLKVGCFICGSGEFTLRSYTNKDGVKQQSAECRSSSFDIDGPRQDAPVALVDNGGGYGSAEQVAPVLPVANPSPTIGGGYGNSEPPFAKPLLADFWG